ncbi:protein phosphatase 1 regulatory subunit 12A-like isoform X2 [Brienomyrus brachyistius]|uniref:protein phosphatase 1 regulatory subunit 12A-like isoform X2 n=1 Tax=Brienomyrus brachyistius TaxID=42636 RepID=UPI0020B36F52|nr:protein phosphatase 1 regulatory subunit 12A-like isoform X2 [Brienomyrus brachyistius]
MKMADAKQKRNEQLKRWLGSETDLEPPILKKKKTKVKFDEGAVFLAACSSGDTEEVLRMLERGADINYANVDGLTALHQACIDDNVDMVTFLVEHGACVNQPDNEGWIPLHAAASCGYMDIAEYLISQGASVGVVNSEGETPLDIAEEEAMEELLQNEINRQGVDIEAARKEEERVMLRDARQWLNSGQIADVRHTKSGGTAMHVAAAKGYAEVLKLLIQAGYDVNIKDFDGWTPLHAAAHWGKEEACRILVEKLCDMDAINKVGQTAFDVADEDVLGYLEELQKKQNLLLSEKRDKKSPLIETTTTGENNQSHKLKNETLLLESEKAPCIESLEPEKADEGEQEGKKDESSCSSEEEDEEDSESENEGDKSKPSAPADNGNSPAALPAAATVPPPSSSPNQVTPTSPVEKSDFITPVMPVASEPSDPALWRQSLRKTGISLVPKKAMVAPSSEKMSVKEEDRKDESPASWRMGLKKTGSYGALAEITARKEAQKDKDAAGVMRSASSPRLSTALDNKEKEKDRGTRLAYVAPTIPSRRLLSTSDIDEKENRDSAASLVRSGSYTRRRWEDDTRNNEGTGPQSRPLGYQRSSSHSLAVGRSSSVRDALTKSPSSSSLEPVSGSTKPWHSLSYSMYRSGSFGRRYDDPLASSTASSSSTSSSVTLSGGPRGVLSSSGSTPSPAPSSVTSRFWSEESAERDMEREKGSAAVIPTVVNTTSTTGTTLGSDGRERRRSYLTPVRDEESESQRKARSRQARQSRRSTQGVTLTDLQEAEKTISRTRPTRTREEEQEEKEKQDKEKQQEERKEAEVKEEDYRSRFRSFDERYRLGSTSTTMATVTSSVSSSSGPLSSSSLNRPNSLSGISSTYGRASRETEKVSDKQEEKDGDDKAQPRSKRERRRPREKRRSTGVSFWTQDGDENDPEQSGSEDGSTQDEPQSDRLLRNDSGSPLSTNRYDHNGSRRLYSSRLDGGETTDYKKLYEQILGENEKLKAQLRHTDLELSELKLQLERATQRQERFADRSQLEMERRERKALERKISEMEEELKNLHQVKQVQALRQINERLAAENRALARVVARLSECCSQPRAASS